MSLREAVNTVLDWHEQWQGQWPDYSPSPIGQLDTATLKQTLGELTERLNENYPFFHPMYVGQMLQPPHPVALTGYLAGMLINPNNHALEGGPATMKLEKECLAQLAKMFGFATHLGHLTSGGTLANLEALWVAKQKHPDRYIVYTDQAHYTHGRMCDLIQARHHKVKTTPEGTMDIHALQAFVEAQPVGTVVVTLGTTSVGALDPLNMVLMLQQKYGFRVHVDCAYGGYFATLAETDPDMAVFRSLTQCDSVVIDPHKHGLLPYGCGAILFQDPRVASIYYHDSPYTYYNSDELHLGEISLECSRPGAAAAALWATLKSFPLSPEGMGQILKQSRDAAVLLAQAIRTSEEFTLHLTPQLDIVTYFPTGPDTKTITEKTLALYESGLNSQTHPLYLAKLNVDASRFSALHPDIAINTDTVTILRSCMMKPEHVGVVPQIMDALFYHAKAINQSALV